jgi:hypothetical protein
MKSASEEPDCCPTPVRKFISNLTKSNLDVVEFRPLTYDDDVDNTDEVVCHYYI